MVVEILLQPTWGFAIVGLDVVAIGSGTHPNFSFGLTTNIKHFISTSFSYLYSTKGAGRRNTNSHHRKALFVIRNALAPMIRGLFSIFFVIFVLISCTIKKSETHLLNFKRFTIETPNTWKMFIGKGLDSYIGQIEMDSFDFASFDWGLYSNDLEEYLKEKTDTTLGWTIYPPLSDLSNLQKSKCLFEIIDGRKAKIIIPLTTGIGVTGVYFDSIFNSNAGNVQLEISGDNLSRKNQESFLKAIRTLKFPQ